MIRWTKIAKFAWWTLVTLVTYCFLALGIELLAGKKHEGEIPSWIVYPAFLAAVFLVLLVLWPLLSPFLKLGEELWRYGALLTGRMARRQSAAREDSRPPFLFLRSFFGSKDNIAGRIRFQDALEEARLSYYAEVGSNPRLTVDVLIGKVYLLAERLASDGEDANATEALFRLAKIRGWIAGEGGEQPSLIDLGARLLTDSDLQRLKAEVKKAEEQGQPFDLASAIVKISREKEQAAQNQPAEKNPKLN